MISHVGQYPLRAGRVSLAVICWRSDFDSYRDLGHSITGSRYVKAEMPGEIRAPRSPLRAVLRGYRLGRIDHDLELGRLRDADAMWLAHQWRDGIPV